MCVQVLNDIRRIENRDLYSIPMGGWKIVLFFDIIWATVGRGGELVGGPQCFEGQTAIAHKHL